MRKEEFTKAEGKKMLLSNRTREGLQTTGKRNSANLLLNLCSQVYTNLVLSVNFSPTNDAIWRNCMEAPV